MKIICSFLSFILVKGDIHIGITDVYIERDRERRTGLYYEIMMIIIIIESETENKKRAMNSKFMLKMYMCVQEENYDFIFPQICDS
jgi:hypothetical protein